MFRTTIKELSARKLRLLTTSIAVKKTVRLKGSMAIAVSIGVRPWTIWI